MKINKKITGTWKAILAILIIFIIGSIIVSILYSIFLNSLDDIINGISNYLFNKEWAKMEKKTEFIKDDDVEQKILKYLQNEYNEEFNIKLYKHGFKLKEKYLLEAGNYYSGYEYDIREDVYIFSPKSNKDIICYIVYRYDTTNQKENIKEIYDGREIGMSSFKVAGYEKTIGFYNIKNKILKELKGYVGEDYKIDLYSGTHEININSNKDLKTILKTDKNKFIALHNNLSNLEEKTNGGDYYMAIKLNYTDYTVEIYGHTYIENQCFDDVQELINYVENNKKK